MSEFIYCLEQYSSILMVYMEIHYSIFTMKLNYSTKSTYTYSILITSTDPPVETL